VSYLFAANLKEREEWVEAISWCAVNSNLENEYILDKGDDGKLGVGSYSKVWAAMDRRLKKNWAIKEICKSDLEQVEVQNLREEVRIQRKVGEHPNIVYMKEMVETADRYYIVMELLSGGALLDHILEAPTRQFSEQHALDIMKQILNALFFLHSKQICHRDLKLENLLLTDEPATGVDAPVFGHRVCIADFGFAANTADGPTCLHGLCGSPGYIAPEIIRDSKDACGYGLAVDMWSMGVILFILLTGNPPFVGDSDDESFNLTSRGRYDWHSLSEVSATARDLVANLLVLKPEKRMTAEQALSHPWILGQGVGDTNLRLMDNFRTLKATVRSKQEVIANGLTAAARKLKLWN